MQSAIEWHLNKKKYPLAIMCTQGSFTTQKKSITELLHKVHLQIPFPKTMKRLSLNNSRKEDLAYLDSGDKN